MVSEVNMTNCSNQGFIQIFSEGQLFLFLNQEILKIIIKTIELMLHVNLCCGIKKKKIYNYETVKMI